METMIVIMKKNSNTGFLEKELASLKLKENEEYILNLFVLEENEKEKFHIRLTTERNLYDWEYAAVFDYYDTDIFKEYDVSEIDGDYNPVWEIVMDYEKDIDIMTEKISEILKKHKQELDDVYKMIRDKKDEYI